MFLEESSEELLKKISQLEERASHAESLLAAMEASRSWAITQPFRTYSSLRREDSVERMIRQYERKLLSLPKSVTISASPPILVALGTRSEYQVGVIIHAHFIDVLESLITPLSQISNLKRIFVTYNNPNFETEIRNLISQYLSPHVELTLLLFENRGRDVLPFLRVLKYIDSNPDQKCEVYLKLHTKKSTHLRNGGAWRDGLVSELVPPNVDELTQYVASNSNLGFVAPLRWTVGSESLGRNRKKVKLLMRRGGFKARTKLVFPAGTMFWFNSNLIELLKPIDFQYEEFETEMGQLDGTTAHAFERIIGKVSIASRSDVWLMN